MRPHPRLQPAVLVACATMVVLAAVSEGGTGTAGTGSAGGIGIDRDGIINIGTEEEIDPGLPSGGSLPASGKKVKRSGRKTPDDAVLQVREWLQKMKANKADAAIQTQGCEKITEIVSASSEALEEVASRGVQRIVAGMHAHPGDEQLQEAGCWVR